MKKLIWMISLSTQKRQRKGQLLNELFIGRPLSFDPITILEVRRVKVRQNASQRDSASSRKRNILVNARSRE